MARRSRRKSGRRKSRESSSARLSGVPRIDPVKHPLPCNQCIASGLSQIPGAKASGFVQAGLIHVQPGGDSTTNRIAEAERQGRSSVGTHYPSITMADYCQVISIILQVVALVVAVIGITNASHSTSIGLAPHFHLNVNLRIH